MYILYQLVRDLQLLCFFKQLVISHRSDLSDLGIHFPDVADSLNDITGTRFAFCSYHRSALTDPSQRFAEISRTADERDFELSLVDMIDVVSRGEHFGFIYVVDLDGLEYLSLYEVSDTAFCHYRDADCLLDTFYHLRVAHPRYAAGCTDIGRDTFECHYGACTGCFCDLCLLRSSDIHDHSAFEHLCESFIQFVLSFLSFIHFLIPPCVLRNEII